MKLERRDTPADGGPPPEDKKEKRGREESALKYATILFIAALTLIALSYLVQRRANETMSDMSAQHGEFSIQAMKNIEDLQNRNITLDQELKDANAEITELKRASEETEKAAAEAETERASLESEIERLQGDLQGQSKELEALTLLAKFLDEEDAEKRAEILDELKTVADALTGEAAAIYGKYITEGTGEQ